MSCERHPGSGIVILSDGTEVCYGCYCEQFNYCPLCGRAWDDPLECKLGELFEQTFTSLQEDKKRWLNGD